MLNRVGSRFRTKVTRSPFQVGLTRVGYQSLNDPTLSQASYVASLVSSLSVPANTQTTSLNSPFACVNVRGFATFFGHSQTALHVISGPKQTLPLRSFAEKAMDYLDRECITSDGRTYKYSDLVRDAAQLASSKLNTYILPPRRKPKFNGDDEVEQTKVAFLFHPSYEYVVAQWAIWSLSGVAVPLYPYHPPPELEYIIKDSCAEVILTHTSFVPKLQPIAEKLGIALVSTDSFPGPDGSTTLTSSFSDPVPLEALSQPAPVTTPAPSPMTAADVAATAPRNPNAKLTDVDARLLHSSSSPFTQPTLSSPRLNEDAMFVYTSGTTGKPKGVRVQHQMLISQIASLVSAWSWTRNDHILNVLPLHHVHGITNVVGCALWSGAKVTFLDSGRGFDPNLVWQRWIDSSPSAVAAAAAGTVSTAKPRLSLFMAVPTIYDRLLATYASAPPEKQEQMRAACSQFRLMVSGSMALPVPTLKRWREVSGQTLLERYGMTEIGMALSNPLHGLRRPGFVGRPLPGVEVALKRDTVLGDKPLETFKKGEKEASESDHLSSAPSQATTPTTATNGDTSHGITKNNDSSSTSNKTYELIGASPLDDTPSEDIVEEGELLVRGPTVFKEYWNKPEATAQAFADGWFRTGDIAGVDAQGCFKILGRSSVDILKVSGYKISALDVERELLAHPLIDQVAVIGLPSETYGQTIVAIIVPRTTPAPPSEKTAPAPGNVPAAPLRAPPLPETIKDSPLTLESLREWCKDKMAEYKIPRGIWVVSDIPRNAMGKVNKKHLVNVFPQEMVGK